MGKCCIPGCRNSRERIPGLTFHQIPSGEPWRALWLDVLGKQGVQLFTEWTLVCGEHFTHEDYKMTARKNFLLPSAIPSVFKETTSSYVPKKRGRKPKSQQAAVFRSLVAEDVDVPDDADDDDASGAANPRRTGRQRRQKVYTDMVVYMPKTPGESVQGIEGSGGGADDGNLGETISFTLHQPPQDDGEVDGDPEYVASDEDDDDGEESDKPASSDPAPGSQPPKNLNVIVFSNQPRRPTRPGGGSEASVTDSEPRPKRRCCQIQTQRLLFYKSVIVKLRKRVLALEASLQEKEKELADLRF
ncbi:hypothetical protein ISCGN_030739 [Ixodes scapularis]|uniref:THAP-type domain-containing protein n=1 Tax=Ixodes scapularis TaxID=6945 RepID=B7QBY0_IXOSC|nr:hypothetical protein IscW_ISCW012574 [Ixodes scapularis]|eukprot:XP_002413044.1 hypothetical protein IscW_ISCW012574 [Ixodes scapularis]